MTEFLPHGRIRLALHRLQAARTPGAQPLLLLHGLGESHRAHALALYHDWPGAVHALDFTGHGGSTVPAGGGYSCEVLMGDVDIALAHLGPSTVCGRGLGAYVALLIAGGRPELVRGAVMLDGPGLAGSCASATPFIPVVDLQQPAPPDPYALAELATDARPAEYARHFARLACERSPLPQPVTVCTREQPPWLRAALEVPGVRTASPREAWRAYAAAEPHALPA